jgi:hypothetical protein
MKPGDSSASQPRIVVSEERFPNLGHNKKKLIEGVSYDQAKKMKGMTD